MRVLPHREFGLPPVPAPQTATTGETFRHDGRTGHTVKWSIRSLIASLRSDATDPYRELVPDGVVDMSEVVSPLVGIASTGRVVNEFEEYNLGRHMANLLQRLLPMPRPTRKDLETALLSLMVVHVATLREAVAIKPDLTIDEILSEALSDEKIKGLQEEFKVVPVSDTGNGGVRPLFGIMKIFSRPVPMTMRSVLGPAIRKLGKLEYFIRQELGEFHLDTDKDVDDAEDDGRHDDDSTDDDE